MRKIRLSDTDAALFDEEMKPLDYEYLAKHKAAFCRMWTDQGVKFWKRYVEVFRSYILRYSLLGDLTSDASQLQGTLDFAFVVITTYFVEGKVNQAKALLSQIADLGKSHTRFTYLDSKSVRKDPFYTKDTRDIFREFFGPANEKSSYIKVYLLTPVYMKFGGSIVRCLSKWMEAKEISPDDDSYYVPPIPIEINSSCPNHARESSSPHPPSVLCPFHANDANSKFSLQYLPGAPTSPVQLHFWQTKDPRFCYPENPLFNPDAVSSDWRDDLTFAKFLEFYVWGSFNEALVKLEDQCPDCLAYRKAKKKKKKKKKAEKNMDECACEDFLDIDDSGDACRGSAAEKWMLDAMAKVCSGACVHPSDIGQCEAELEGHSSPLASQLSAAIALQHTAPEDIDTLMNGMTLQAEKLDRRLDMIYMQMNAALVCSKQPDCHCSKCVLSRKFSEDYMKDDSGISLLLGLSPNGVKENEKPAVQKPKKREMPEVGEMTSADIDRRARTTFGQKMLRKKMVTKRKTDIMKLPLPGDENLRSHFEVQTRTDPENNASEMCVTVVDVDISPGTKPSDFEHMYKLGKVVIQSLAYEYIDRMAKDVPVKFCAEGRDWCLVEIDYRQGKETAGAKDTTHFVLKLSNSGINSARGITVLKGVLLELLQYVARRKKRPSPGWILNEDDIFVFLQSLGVDYYQVKGTTFNITTGCSGIDLINPEEFSQWLMTLPPILRGTQYSARRNLADTRDLLSKIGAEPETAAWETVPAEDSAADKPNTSKTKQKKNNKNRNKREEEKPAGEATSSMGAEHVVQNGLSVQNDKANAAGDADHALQARNKQAAATAASAPITTNAKSSNPPQVQAGKERETSDVGEKRRRSMYDIDGSSDEDMEVERAKSYGEVIKKRLSDVEAGLLNNLNRCSNCDRFELYPPPFGKCGRCVEEKVSKPRYYCGEECQRAHWSTHRQEHVEGIQ